MVAKEHDKDSRTAEASGSDLRSEDHAAIGQALLADPTAGVRIITADGLILFINEQATRMFHGPDANPADLIGRNCHELFPPDVVRERLEIFDRVISTNRPTLLRVIWDGRQILNWVHPILPGCDPLDDAPDAEASQTVHVVIVSRYGDVSDEIRRGGETFDYVDSDVVDLGPLDVLTPRELEVLALLGQGLSVREIARALHRSEKTIETHRTSIGRKLGIDDRVKLAAVAFRAGLTVADALRSRTAPER